MNIFAWINKQDKNHGWSLMGFALAIPLGVFSIYSANKVENPNARFEVIGNEPVLDLREDVSDLQVIYRGDDILSKGESLSVGLIRLSNRGSRDIVLNDYDESFPLALKISNGEIVRATISDASNEYLRNKDLLGWSEGDNQVFFRPSIIEQEQWVLVKVLARHSANVDLTFSSSGKVAGQEEVTTVTSSVNDAPRGFWTDTFSGSIQMQAVRVVTYFFFGIALLFATITPVVYTLGKLTERRRRRIVENFRRKTKSKVRASDDIFFTTFIEAGISPLKKFIKHSKHDYFIKIEVERNLRRFHGHKGSKVNDFEFDNSLEAPEHSKDSSHIYMDFPSVWNSADLIDSGTVVQEGDKWIVPDDKRDLVIEFIEFVRITTD